MSPDYATQQSADLTPRLTVFCHDTPLLHAELMWTKRYAGGAGYETRPATGY
ncbi:protein of unknown function [Candidatus Filomicrobium marinum]|uniref:Uncharacterized protein n=1 Tax=Candidatus Filomicrobium marinum TaxID=1608628 RepID=A0A0D6JCL3_9HYPH|nr:protein of unknown function [Candidatus Filomicrobium marinum]CPR16563.1 protein of unknown function [Candidatus Filomicrobium marinum]